MKKLFLTLLILFFSVIGYSQEANSFSVWGNIGAGLGFGNGGFTYNYGLSAKLHIWMISAKHWNETEFSFNKPIETINTYSVLFGLSNKLLDESSVIELNINMISGISYVEFNMREEIIALGRFSNEYELIKTTSLGIPMELEMELRFTKYVGISVAVISNINGSVNTFGTNLNLLVGFL